MKRFVIAVLVAFLSFTTLSFAGSDQAKQQALEQRAWRLIDDGALLIDVRSRQEFEAGHLDNSINIEFDKVGELTAAIGENKDRDVVVYCRSGKRAERAKESLKGYGYNNIFNGKGYDGLKKERQNSG